MKLKSWPKESENETLGSEPFKLLRKAYLLNSTAPDSEARQSFKNKDLLESPALDHRLAGQRAIPDFFFWY